MRESDVDGAVSRGTYRLVLELERGAEPIAGWIQAPDGATWPFVGWVMLVHALEAALAQDR